MDESGATEARDGAGAPRDDVWGPHSLLMGAYGDGTVSRIRSGYEVRYTKRFEEGARAKVAEAVHAIARPRFSRGKLLEQADGARLAAAFAAAYADAPFMLSSHDGARAPTRVKPRSWAYYSRRFHVAAAPDGLMRMHACELRAERRSVEAKVTRTTFSWTRHAQTRLHQRTPRRVRADRLIADAVLDHAGLLHLSCADAALGAPARFAIPCHEGLLCGFIGRIDPDAVIADHVGCDTVGQHESRYRDVEMELDPTFVGVTYLGDDELWPDQRRLRCAMAELATHYRPLGEALRSGFCGRSIEEEMRDAKGRQPEREGGDAAAARLRPDERVVEATRALFTSPWAMRAMGNRLERGGAGRTITTSLAEAEGAVIEALAPASDPTAAMAMDECPEGQMAPMDEATMEEAL